MFLNICLSVFFLINSQTSSFLLFGNDIDTTKSPLENITDGSTIETNVTAEINTTPDNTTLQDNNTISINITTTPEIITETVTQDSTTPDNTTLQDNNTISINITSPTIEPTPSPQKKISIKDYLSNVTNKMVTYCGTINRRGVFNIDRTLGKNTTECKPLQITKYSNPLKDATNNYLEKIGEITTQAQIDNITECLSSFLGEVKRNILDEDRCYIFIDDYKVYFPLYNEIYEIHLYSPRSMIDFHNLSHIELVLNAEYEVDERTLDKNFLNSYIPDK